MTLIKYFFFEKENLFSEIQKELEQKLDALVARELYTKYKTAPTEEEKEKAENLLWEQSGGYLSSSSYNTFLGGILKRNIYSFVPCHFLYALE